MMVTLTHNAFDGIDSRQQCFEDINHSFVFQDIPLQYCQEILQRNNSVLLIAENNYFIFLTYCIIYSS